MQLQLPQLSWQNETTFNLAFERSPSIAMTQTIAAYRDCIINNFGRYIDDVVPAYSDIMIVLSVAHNNPEALAQDIRQLASTVVVENNYSPADTYIIPVNYSIKCGPDLPRVAEYTGLTVQGVIDLHCAKTYSVCALGFAPGFPYLGFIDERLVIPRKATPSRNVAAGSVAIAHNQTGIYPRESPGGWHIIGHTSVQCFDFTRPPESAHLFKVGMQVRFNPIH